LIPSRSTLRHGAPLNAADHHASFGVVELGAVFVRADLGEQFRVDLGQVHVLARDFPRPRKCRTVRCARAHAHHSSSVGYLTAQVFSPPDKIGTTNGFDASKTGFVSVRVI